VKGIFARRKYLAGHPVDVVPAHVDILQGPIIERHELADRFPPLVPADNRQRRPAAGVESNR
jgi:hypothetical protein